MFSLNWPPLPVITDVMAGGYSSSANGTQWTISLRPNLKWDNGSPLNSTDLWYTLVLYNESGAFTPKISNMSIANATSVNVTLAGPNHQFILTGFIDNGISVLPYQTFKGMNYTAASAFQNYNNIVADGPFVIQNYSTSQNPVLLQANTNYWNGAPKVSQLSYNLYSSLSAEFSAYTANQLDAVAYTGAYSGLTSIANQTGQHLIGPPYATPGLTMEALLNNWVAPTNNTTFRRALAFATNVALINNELSGPYANSSTANQDFLLPQYNRAIGFPNDTGPTGYTYNVTEAKALMATVPGLKYSGSTLEYSNGTQVSLSIKYRTTVDNSPSASVAQILDSEWSAIGISVTPEAIVSTTLRSGPGNNNASDWQVIAAGVLGPLTNNGVTPGPGILQDLGDFWVNMNGTHDSWNATFYSIIQRMRTEAVNSSAFNTDAKTAASIYVQGVPSIPLFNEYNWAAVSNNFNWGSPSSNNGVYYTQAITGLVYWALALDVVAPSSGNSSSSSTVTSSSSSTNSTSVTSSPTNSSSSVSSTGTQISTSSGTVSSSSTSTTDNTLLYVGAGIIVLIIIIAAVALVMRRRRPAAPPAATP
jgi:peptide/nickel transport system substrate-binding protein